MTLTERTEKLYWLFTKLELEPSTTEKRKIIKEFVDDELHEDFMYCIEVLAGKHKTGYTYRNYATCLPFETVPEEYTVKDVFEKVLLMPLKAKDLSSLSISIQVARTNHHRYFFAPLVDREWRLGIGTSLISKQMTSPMLAKRYEGYMSEWTKNLFVTEKLDGNRCITYFGDDAKWHHVSRNGKEMNVEFDTSSLDPTYIYDGEVLSPIQVEMSEEIRRVVHEKIETNTTYNSVFNRTSGLINRHNKTKDLVYNIFDVTNSGLSYVKRRTEIVDLIKPTSNVRVLPVLEHFATGTDLMHGIDELLFTVTSIGGEGLIINRGERCYESKRTDSLLKYKEVKTMDMRVTGITDGTGKYLGMCGALECMAILPDGSSVVCSVGSGLDDQQRFYWYLHPETIVGQIVEVEYFGMSQNKDTIGTKLYSLRFPRLKGIRHDKTTTSTY